MKIDFDNKITEQEYMEMHADWISRIQSMPVRTRAQRARKASATMRCQCFLGFIDSLFSPLTITQAD